MEQKVAEEKLKYLESYCGKNHIWLQPKKCKFIVINEMNNIDTAPIIVKIKHIDSV